jgi:hypothetical protein
LTRNLRATARGSFSELELDTAGSGEPAGARLAMAVRTLAPPIEQHPTQPGVVQAGAPGLLWPGIRKGAAPGTVRALAAFL